MFLSCLSLEGDLCPPPCIGKPPAVLKHAFDLWSCLSNSALQQLYHSEILLLALLSFLAKSVSTVWSVKAAKQLTAVFSAGNGCVQ